MDDKKPRSRQASESQPRSRQASESQVAPNATPPVSQPEKSAEKKDAEPERREKADDKKEEVPKKPVIEIAEDVKNVKDVKEAKDVKEDDMDGWEAAPVKGKGNKKGKNGKGKGIQRQEKVEQKTPAKKTVESVKNVNSEPVKVEPVEPKAKVIPAEKETETPPEPKVEQVVEVKEVEPVVEKVEAAKVEEKSEEAEKPKENGISAAVQEPETDDSVFEKESQEAAAIEAATESNAASESATPDIKTPEPEAEGSVAQSPSATPTPSEEAKKEEGDETDGSDPKAVANFSSIASENRAKIEAGEKVAYERDFLLKFQSACLGKPRELPNLDVILDGPTEGHKKPPVHERRTGHTFDPHWAQNKKGQSKGPRQGDRRRPSQNVRQISLPSSRNIQLKRTENPYQRGITTDLADDEKVTAKLVRDTVSILNKLTPELEEKLTKRFTSELNPDSYNRLEKVVKALFSKALDDVHFSELYARLCRNCHDTWVKNDKFAFVNVGTDKEPKYQKASRKSFDQNKSDQKIKSFREVLLNQAQKEFLKLKHINAPDKSLFEEGTFEWRRLDVKEKLDALPKKDSPEYNKRKEMELEEEYAEMNVRIKTRSLGNTKFVGELYKIGMLSINIMFSCIRQLVTSDNLNEVESLCKLIPTIGARMEDECARKDAGKNKLPTLFASIHDIIKKGKTLGENPSDVPPRVICLLQDVLDLKKRQWHQREGIAPQGPKKIADLHQSHQDKVMHDAKRTEAAYNHHRKERREENQNRKNKIDTGDWVTTQRVNNQKFNPKDLMVSKTSSSNSNEPMQLGPRRRGGGRGKHTSMDGKSTPETTPNQSGRNTPVEPHTSNIFASLADDDRMSHPNSGRTQSNRFDSRRHSEMQSEMRAPQERKQRMFHSQGKSTTHDGRMEKRKLSDAEVEKKSGTIANDIKEAAGKIKGEGGLEEVVKDVQTMELCNTLEHQKILVHHLIEKVLETKDKDRLDTGTFLAILGETVKGIDFVKILDTYVAAQVEADVVTDCPKFWQYLGMITAKLFAFVDAKLLTVVVEHAKEAMQSTKAAVSLLEEIDLAFRSKSKLHAIFSASGLNIQDCMAADDIEGDAKQRLEDRHPRLAYLLEPYVEIQWAATERGLREMLKEHDFSKYGEIDPDFSKEFDFVESKVPEGREGRLNVKFTRVIINAVISYAVNEKNNLITRTEGSDGAKETNLSDCELLLRKYLDGTYAQLDTLDILADLFHDKYDNNATLIKETFNELYEIRVIDIDAFMKWKVDPSAQKRENYAVIIAATKSFYDALQEEKNEEEKAKRQTAEQSAEQS